MPDEDRAEPAARSFQLLEIRSRRVGDWVVLAVRGEIDLATGPQLRATLTDTLRAEPAGLVVDLSDVAFLGSTGLSALIEVSDALGPTRLRIVASTSPTLRPIELTGLHQVLAVFRDLDSALEAP
jgi:anti-anti-sigma factor